MLNGIGGEVAPAEVGENKKKCQTVTEEEKSKENGSNHQE
jgi:hypothetical protein